MKKIINDTIIWEISIDIADDMRGTGHSQYFEQILQVI